MARNPEVVVVGAGPVGLFAALTVAARGHRVRIIDKEWRPTAHSYALALHGASIGLLDTFGLAGPVLDRAKRIRRTVFHAGMDEIADVDLKSQHEDFSFAAVLRQDVLERMLVDALASHHVRVDWNHELAQIEASSDGVEVTIDKLSREGLGYAVQHGEWVVSKSRTETAQFVIGADGNRSRVRRAIGIRHDEVSPAQHFAVFEFATDADLGDAMRIALHNDLLNLVWPMPDGYCRWSFEIREDEAPILSRIKDRSEVQLGGINYPVLSEAALRAFLEKRAPWFSGSIDEIRWKLLVRFERRLAQRMGEGRVWLAGDAAHMTGPVGIQSMNVGLREAHRLGNAIADLLEGRADADALEAYNTDQRAEWRTLLGLDGPLRPGSHVVPQLTQHSHQLISCLPASGDDLAVLVGQMGFGMPEGAES